MKCSSFGEELGRSTGRRVGGRRDESILVVVWTLGGVGYESWARRLDELNEYLRSAAVLVMHQPI